MTLPLSYLVLTGHLFLRSALAENGLKLACAKQADYDSALPLAIFETCNFDGLSSTRRIHNLQYIPFLIILVEHLKEGIAAGDHPRQTRSERKLRNLGLRRPEIP
jgi:hypothetical protein